MPPTPDAAVATLIARQPIVSQDQQVFGHELLYRRAPGDEQAEVLDGRIATADVMNAALASDLGALGGNLPNFINFERALLLSDFASLLQPPEDFVIEVLESVPLDADVLARCDALRAQGFHVALDDVDSPERVEAFGRRADFVKIDWDDVPSHTRDAIITAAHRAQAAVIVERIETEAEFAAAIAAGCDYIQGYFVGRPAPVSGRTLPPIEANLLELVTALGDPDTSQATIEAMVSRDVALTYRVLRFANSAQAAQQHEVSALRSAIGLMGRDQLRRFACLLLLSGMVVDCPAYMVELALARARFCEDLARLRGDAPQAANAFLAGMLSTVDVLIGAPMEEVLQGIVLPAEVVAGLLLGDGEIGTMLDFARSYEAGRWDQVEAAVDRDQLPRRTVLDTYAHALTSAKQIVAAAA